MGEQSRAGVRPAVAHALVVDVRWNIYLVSDRAFNGIL
jgi:hypothetical protein